MSISCPTPFKTFVFIEFICPIPFISFVCQQLKLKVCFFPYCIFKIDHFFYGHSHSLFFHKFETLSEIILHYSTIVLLGFPPLTMLSRYMFPKLLRSIQVSILNSRSVALLRYFSCLSAAAIYCHLKIVEEMSKEEGTKQQWFYRRHKRKTRQKIKNERVKNKNIQETDLFFHMIQLILSTSTLRHLHSHSF